MSLFMKTPVAFTKVNGIRTRGTDGVMKSFLQVIFTKDIMKMVKRLVRVLTIG